MSHGCQKRFPNSENAPLTKALHELDAADIEKKLLQEWAKIKESASVIDSMLFLNKALKEKKSLLLEGANATMLDIDFGTYPYVTSSSTSVGGVFSGLGISPDKLEASIGVVKAYTTRVGDGPFPTELSNEIGEKLRKIGAEFGTTTGRPRRCGWLDLVVIKYTHMINNYKYINLTKLDVLSDFDVLRVGVSYTLQGKELESMPASLEVLGSVEVVYKEFKGWNKDISKVKSFDELPHECQEYVKFIEKEIGVHIKWIGVGPGRLELIERPASN